ncbi:MAG: hypothetical protein EBU84_00300 [Actinobacteria bacterium]|nr:hypothetical protein [Actinomycetota bacterium]
MQAVKAQFEALQAQSQLRVTSLEVELRAALQAAQGAAGLVPREAARLNMEIRELKEQLELEKENVRAAQQEKRHVDTEGLFIPPPQQRADYDRVAFYTLMAHGGMDRGGGFQAGNGRREYAWDAASLDGIHNTEVIYYNKMNIVLTASAPQLAVLHGQPYIYLEKLFYDGDIYAKEVETFMGHRAMPWITPRVAGAQAYTTQTTPLALLPNYGLSRDRPGDQWVAGVYHLGGSFSLEDAMRFGAATNFSTFPNAATVLKVRRLKGLLCAELLENITGNPAHRIPEAETTVRKMVAAISAYNRATYGDRTRAVINVTSCRWTQYSHGRISNIATPKHMDIDRNILSLCSSLAFDDKEAEKLGSEVVSALWLNDGEDKSKKLTALATEIGKKSDSSEWNKSVNLKPGATESFKAGGGEKGLFKRLKVAPETVLLRIGRALFLRQTELELMGAEAQPHLGDQLNAWAAACVFRSLAYTTEGGPVGATGRNSSEELIPLIEVLAKQWETEGEGSSMYGFKAPKGTLRALRLLENNTPKWAKEAATHVWVEGDWLDFKSPSVKSDAERMLGSIANSAAEAVYIAEGSRNIDMARVQYLVDQGLLPIKTMEYLDLIYKKHDQTLAAVKASNPRMSLKLQAHYARESMVSQMRDLGGEWSWQASRVRREPGNRNSLFFHPPFSATKNANRAYRGTKGYARGDPIYALEERLAAGGNSQQILGEELYRLIQARPAPAPILAGKITGMLLEGLTETQLIELIQNPEELSMRIAQAVEILRSNGMLAGLLAAGGGAPASKPMGVMSFLKANPGTGKGGRRRQRRSTIRKLQKKKNKTRSKK